MTASADSVKSEISICLLLTCAATAASAPPMLEALRVDYPTWEYFLAATQLVLATLGLGITLHPRDFLLVLRAPRGLILIFVCQLLLAPPLGLGLAWLWGLPPGFALGMVLMSAMPAGAMSGVFVYYGYGRAALALAGTGLTTLTSLITTTVMLQLFGRLQISEEFVMPVGQMIMEFSLFLLLPFVVAMVLGRTAPRRAPSIGKWCMRGSLVTLTTLVIGSLVSGRLQIAAYGFGPPAALAGYAASVMVVGYLVSLLVRLPRADSFTVGLLTTIRNGNLALLLKARLFPAAAGADAIGDAVLYVILFYSGAALVISGGAVALRRAIQHRAQAAAAIDSTQPDRPLATAPTSPRGPLVDPARVRRAKPGPA